LKIAFVGDSFCSWHGPGTPVGEDFELGMELSKKYGLDIGQDTIIPDDHDQHDWPVLVTKHFDAIPTHCGIMGVNFYHSFEFFQQKTKDEDYIIFCPTEPYRLINKHKLPINGTWLKEIITQTTLGKWVLDYSADGADKVRHKGLNKEQIMEIAVGAKYYGDNIMDADATLVTHHALLMYVDNMMVEKGKKCLWLNSFPEFRLDWMKPFIPRSGPIGNRDLFSITKGRDHSHPLARNHMFKDEQVTMSKMIIDMIENDRFQPGKFSMDKWFPKDENVENERFYYLKKTLDAKDNKEIDGFPVELDRFIYP
jgi:hypothetical protein